jgi:hypothetical protein
MLDPGRSLTVTVLTPEEGRMPTWTRPLPVLAVLLMVAVALVAPVPGPTAAAGKLSL